jgi:hypothetical protein
MVYPSFKILVMGDFELLAVCHLFTVDYSPLTTIAYFAGYLLKKDLNEKNKCLASASFCDSNGVGNADWLSFVF